MDASGTDISLRVYPLLSMAVSMCYQSPLCVCVCDLMCVFLDAVGGCS